MKKFLNTLGAKIGGMVAGITGFLAPVAVHAVTVNSKLGQSVGLGSGSPESIAISIVNWALGLLALVAVVLILIGGFMWMTAAGNEEKIEKAKKILTAAIIGLIIVLAAWGIALYAIRTFGASTGSVSPT